MNNNIDMTVILYTGKVSKFTINPEVDVEYSTNRKQTLDYLLEIINLQKYPGHEGQRILLSTKEGIIYINLKDVSIIETTVFKT